MVLNKTPSFRKKIALLLVVAFLHTSTLFSAEGGRSARRFGLTLTGHGDPAPSGMGFNLNYNLTSFLRLNAGVGGYNDWLGENGGAAISNYTIRPFAYAISYSMLWFLSAIFIAPFGGKIYKLKYDGFLERGYSESRSSFSYGGGGRLFVPGWFFSPTVGMHWSRYVAENKPFGLSERSQMHTYYSGGFDWQSPAGFNLAAGFNVCPKIPKSACGVYLNLGVFF